MINSTSHIIYALNDNIFFRIYIEYLIVDSFRYMLVISQCKRSVNWYTISSIGLYRVNFTR